jgi:aldehyde:ferredoxin oxidoreductase
MDFSEKEGIMRFIRVNMTQKTIHTEEVPEDYVGLAGRGLTSIMINTEVPPKCDPLGPENKLIVAPGFLSGTPLVNTSRISIGAKSPLTGTIKESNAGGTVAAALGRLGITAIIIEGQAQDGEISFLRIDEKGNAFFIPVRATTPGRGYWTAGKKSAGRPWPSLSRNGAEKRPIWAALSASFTAPMNL